MNYILLQTLWADPFLLTSHSRKQQSLLFLISFFSWGICQNALGKQFSLWGLKDFCYFSFFYMDFNSVSSRMLWMASCLVDWQTWNSKSWCLLTSKSRPNHFLLFSVLLVSKNSAGVGQGQIELSCAGNGPAPSTAPPPSEPWWRLGTLANPQQTPVSPSNRYRAHVCAGHLRRKMLLKSQQYFCSF